MRIAVFGGSFNPPHLGHQVLCLMLLETCAVDALWLVPTYKHVFGKELVAFEDRVRCCEAMLQPFGERAQVVKVEQELALAGHSEEGSRMLDTLEALSEKHPDTNFRLVIGADILGETDKWHRFDEVAQLAPPIVFKRKGYPGGELWAPPEISSSDIRQRLKRGESIEKLVPRAVLECIQNRGLYQ